MMQANGALEITYSGLYTFFAFLILSCILLLLLDYFRYGKSFKSLLFKLRAEFIAPAHFKPKSCPIKDKSKCDIWNCKYHYKNNRYDDCQFKED